MVWMQKVGIISSIVLAFASPVWAWHSQGHEAISRAAVEALTEDVPAFLRQSGAALAQDSVDPDLVRTGSFKALGIAKSPDHFFDLEPLGNIQKDTLPPDRYSFLMMLSRKHLNPRQIGMGLYALQESRQKLTIALAEHRKWPNNQAIQAKCIVYASEMAHYAEDLCQPLHTTIRHNGQLDANGRTSGSGIHDKVDSLIDYLPAENRKPPKGLKLQSIGPDLGSLMAYILAAHQLVDRVYELEPLLPTGKTDKPLDPQVLALTQERFNTAVLFTASLMETAWRDSASIQLPGWLDRPEQ